jgi:predicted nucleic-acid-binding Zn-ribbon protein
MAKSKCIKCAWEVFEVVEVQPAPFSSVPDSKVKYGFVQCANCGGVVGVVDPPNREPATK